MLSFIKDITGIGNDQTHIIENNQKQGEQQDKNADQEKTTMLNQGTYGCVFRPGIECSGKQLTSKKYITKIQKYKQIIKLYREDKAKSQYKHHKLSTTNS